MPEPVPVKPTPTSDGPGPFLEGGDIFVLGKDVLVGNSGLASDKAGIDFVGVNPDEELRIRRVLTSLHHVEDDEGVPPAPPIQGGRLGVLRTPGFWLMTLLLVLATLVLTVFVPSVSRCVWGASC